MYVRNKTIKSINRNTTIMILAIFVLFIILVNRPSDSHNGTNGIQTVVTQEIAYGYTVERYNGEVTTLYLDLGVYVYTDCDYMTKNDEGHNCVIADKIKIWEELTKIGY